MLREDCLRLVGAPKEHVDRDLEEDGTGTARGGRAEGLSDQVRDAVGMSHAMRPLGDRPQERHLVEAALQRQRLGVAQRRGAGDEQRRDAVEVRVRDRRDDVGHARPGRDHRDADAAGGAGPAVGRVARGLLMAGVDPADAASSRRLVDRVEMASVQGEHLADALRFEDADQHLAAVDARHGSSLRARL